MATQQSQETASPRSGRGQGMPPEEYQRVRRRISYWDAQPEETRAYHGKYLEALNEMDTAAFCLGAIEVLLNPDPDSLGGDARDKLAVLMGYLLDHYRNARDAMGEAARELEDRQLKGESELISGERRHD